MPSQSLKSLICVAVLLFLQLSNHIASAACSCPCPAVTLNACTQACTQGFTCTVLYDECGCPVSKGCGSGALATGPCANSGAWSVTRTTPAILPKSTTKAATPAKTSTPSTPSTSSSPSLSTSNSSSTDSNSTSTSTTSIYVLPTAGTSPTKSLNSGTIPMTAGSAIAGMMMIASAFFLL